MVSGEWSVDTCVTFEATRPKFVVVPVRLSVNDANRAERIRAALGDWAVELSDATEQTPRLVITDHARRDALVEELGQVGVITVCGGAGDVTLDDDFTPRELRLACELLDEIVKLRRASSDASVQQREWQALALADPLTGLPNRRAWEETLQRCRDDQRMGSFCVAILDLDHFKRINDEHGHAAGDDVLRATADALRKNVRSHDFAARLGGDEFAILLDPLNPADAESVLERIRASVCRELANLRLRAITASVGLAASDPLSPSDATKLYSAASDALRHAKRTGRDRTIREAV